ncbi:hypothetical protein EGI22_02030 [Lacihabitans sp. LS3-19]|uniref:hypothetical protein n=1 Tax=Lacihabitans sp. LS3-19 TaxID=2487335 RepID=UPI0020CE1AEC|nr:hypothetical protein [Lacihabitans sp. LS3-19]MCP9766669.1 hypothetical protein [Lacihabitans sp. LS3-19]
MKNIKSLILIAFIMIPISGISKPIFKKCHKNKTVKTSRRNMMDIEFGTFRYESPVVAKKSVFIG